MLSIEEVHGILHRGVLTLQRWQPAPLLSPCWESMVGSKERWWHRRKNVEAFADHYISAKEAAILLECSELTVQSWTRVRIIPAASGPGIDGCHSYRFEKARLGQWREERMSYQEASQWLGRNKATLHRWIQQGQLTPLPDSRGKSRWFVCSAVTQLAPAHTAGLS